MAEAVGEAVAVAVDVGAGDVQLMVQLFPSERQWGCCG